MEIVEENKGIADKLEEARMTAAACVARIALVQRTLGDMWTEDEYDAEHHGVLVALADVADDLKRVAEL